MKRILFPLSIICFALACGGLSSHSFISNNQSEDGIDIVAQETLFIDGEPVRMSLMDYTDYTQQPTGDQYYNTQKNYHLNSLDLGTTWNNYRGDGVTIAVIDTGINYTHNDFVYYNTTGTSISDLSACFTYSSGTVTTTTVQEDGWTIMTDAHGHGTNVASTIASRINGTGCVGVAPNVNLMFLKAPNLITSEVTTAIRYAADHGADIISMSIGLYDHSFTSPATGEEVTWASGANTVFSSAINYAHNKGCIIFAAAGNDNTPEKSYPASNNYVIGVGALASQSRTTKANYSNYNNSANTSSSNNNVDVTVVGSVYVAGKDSNTHYKSTQGTSFACPITAAAMALYLQKNPSASISTATDALFYTCDDIGDSCWDSTFGYGCVSISKLLDFSYDATGIELSRNYISMYTNDIYHLTATVLPVYASNKLVHWTSSNPSVVSLSSNTSTSGDEITLTAGSVAGSSTITARSDDGDFTATCTVEIEEYVSSEFSITSDTSLSLIVGDTSQITTSWVHSNPSEPELSYSSNDETVVTVSNTGLITAVASGTTTIDVSSIDDEHSINVTVNNDLPHEWKLVTDVNSLSNGDKVIFVNESDSNAAGNLSSTYLAAESVTISDHTITTLPDAVEVFTLGKNGNNYSFQFESGSYLYAEANALYNTSSSGRYSNYTMSIGESSPYNATIKGNGSYQMYYNHGSPRFRTYNSAQQSLQLYKKEYIDPTKTLTGISLSGQTTSYFVGDTFSFTGTCTATWVGNTIGTVQARVTPTSVSSPDMSTSGNKTITVTYTDDFGTASTTYVINVTAISVTSISVSNQKTAFTVGDTFSFGGTVTAHLNNGGTQNVTASSTFTGYNMSEAGEQTVTVTYSGHTTTYTITVSAAPEPSSESTTGVINFINANSPVTAPTDHSTWTYTNCTKNNSYLAMTANSSKITSSTIVVDTGQSISVDAHLGTYGGSGSSVKIYGKNSSGVIVTNQLTLTPTSSSNVSYPGTLTFTDTDDSSITFEVVANVKTAGSIYIRMFTLQLTYTAGVLPPAVTNLSLDKNALALDLNGSSTGTITPTVTYEEGADTTVSYVIADSTVASLSKSSGTKDETIIITGLKVGTTKVTATCGGQSAECSISVVDTTPIPATNISLDKNATSLVHNGSTTLTATITPDNATNKNMTWTTSNSGIVSLSSESGATITIIAQGTTGQNAIITARTNDGTNLTATCTVTIIDEIVQVGTEISGYNETVPYKSTYSVGDVVVKKVMSDGNKIVVTPTSTNYTVDTGVLGNHTISATFGGFTGTGTVKVTNNGASGNVGTSSTQPATVSHTFSSGTDKDDSEGIISYVVASSTNWEDNRGHQWSKTSGTITLTGIDSSKTIKSVTVVASGNCVYTISCTVGGVAFGTNQSVSNGDSKVDKTFEGSSAGGTIVITLSEGSKSSWIKGFTVNYETIVTYPATPEQQAIAWAVYFNSFTAEYCDEAGINTDTDGLASIWTEVKNEYTYMTVASKLALLQSSNADALLAVKVYKIIVYKYDLDDFIEDANGDSIVPGHLYMNLLGVSANNTVIVLTSVLLVLSITGGYIYLRKKKIK